MVAVLYGETTRRPQFTVARRTQPSLQLPQAGCLTLPSDTVRKLSTAVSLAGPTGLKIAPSQQQITEARRAQASPSFSVLVRLSLFLSAACKHLSVSICLCLSVSLSLSVCLFLCLSMSVSICLCLSVCLSNQYNILSLSSLRLSLSLSVFLCLCLSVSVYLSLSLFLCLSSSVSVFSLSSLSLYVLPYYLSLPVCFSVSVSVSVCHTVFLRRTPPACGWGRRILLKRMKRMRGGLSVEDRSCSCCMTISART